MNAVSGTWLRRALAPVLPIAVALTWAIPAMTADAPVWSVRWNIAPATTAPTWTPELADKFPGCHKRLPDGEIPATVIEIQKDWPVRVTFADAWARTHDQDSGNHGRVIALCR